VVYKLTTHRKGELQLTRAVEESLMFPAEQFPRPRGTRGQRKSLQAFLFKLKPLILGITTPLLLPNRIKCLLVMMAVGPRFFFWDPGLPAGGLALTSGFCLF
jgi:hypothetical protein